MTYNIHPILVHFPIALLFIYSIIKILPFEKWFPKVSWKHIELAMLFFGVLGAFAALATGETAQHLFRPNRQLVNMHANFAVIATWLYGALLAGEMLAVINPIILPIININLVTKILTWFEKLICEKVFSKIIAFLALIAIVITGLLGGVMVYGATADPIAGIVLKLLGISI